MIILDLFKQFKASLYRLLRDSHDKNEYIFEIQILKWLRQILCGLVYLHSNMILHAWLNPRYVCFIRKINFFKRDFHFYIFKGKY